MLDMSVHFRWVPPFTPLDQLAFLRFLDMDRTESSSRNTGTNSVPLGHECQGGTSRGRGRQKRRSSPHATPTPNQCAANENRRRRIHLMHRNKNRGLLGILKLCKKF
jgi:hypothetical protein